MLGLWDGNPIKLDCDDHCSSINVINSLSNKKNKVQPKFKKTQKTLQVHFLITVVSEFLHMHKHFRLHYVGISIKKCN